MLVYRLALHSKSFRTSQANSSPELPSSRILLDQAERVHPTPERGHPTPETLRIRRPRLTIVKTMRPGLKSGRMPSGLRLQTRASQLLHSLWLELHRSEMPSTWKPDGCALPPLQRAPQLSGAETEAAARAASSRRALHQALPCLCLSHGSVRPGPRAARPSSPCTRSASRCPRMRRCRRRRSGKSR